MNRALAATLVMLSFSANAASAQSYVESNAKDALCEWQFKHEKGIGRCRIVAMGTHAMDDLVFVLRVNNVTAFFIENGVTRRKSAAIGQGGFWDFKAKWEGTYKSKYKMLGDPENSMVGTDTFKLSNGYTIKVVY